jgi:D-lactate dehydrogenase
MRIAIFEVEQREASAFSRLEADHEVRLIAQPLRDGNVEEFADSEAVSVFVYSRLDRDRLARLPSLRLIATRSTGFDHIDLGYCAERGITVSNVPTYGESTVAEHVFALLLAVSHRLPEAVERARSGRFSPEGLEGFDLQGKTMGVVGTGNIGHNVIRIANGFGMRVIATDLKPDEGLAAALGFRYASFDELLSASDVITLHLPASAGTRHLVSASAFARMKDGVVIINTARGELIDTPALIEALVSGKVAGAGLDVLPDEPLIREEAELISSIRSGERDLRNLVADHVLLRMRNVIVTPHSAFNTREALARIVETTIANIEAFASGKPQNVVR